MSDEKKPRSQAAGTAVTPDRSPEISDAEHELGRRLTDTEKAAVNSGRAAVVQGQLVESSTGDHAADARK